MFAGTVANETINTEYRSNMQLICFIFKNLIVLLILLACKIMKKDNIYQEDTQVSLKTEIGMIKVEDNNRDHTIQIELLSKHSS